MKVRSLLLGLLVAASAQTAASAAQAENVVLVDIMLPLKKGGAAGATTPDPIAEIKVDGSLQKGPYDSVRSKTLEYIIAARTEPHKKVFGGPFLDLSVDGGGGFDGSSGSILSEDWRHYAVTRDYIDPRAHGIAGSRVSPVDLCNDRLMTADGSARATFLKKGVSFLYKDAYEVNGFVSAWIDKPGVFDKQVFEAETIRVPVKITCMALGRPRPRENSETKGAPPRQGKPMKPTISAVGLRIEPAEIVQDGKYLCPTKLKLYGTVDVIRKFYGQALFVGPHYLSNITTLNYPDKGHRNVTGTYPIEWHKAGAFTVDPSAAPAKQTLSFRFNVADKDGKVLESAQKTIEVSCRKIKVNAPTAGNGMTVNPAD